MNFLNTYKTSTKLVLSSGIGIMIVELLKVLFCVLLSWSILIIVVVAPVILIGNG